MGIEVDQSHLAAMMIDRPQQWKRDGVISADADQAPDLSEQVLGRRLDLADGFFNIKWVAGHVTCIGCLLHEEWFHVVRGMIVRAKVPGRLPDCERPKARAGPVAGPGLKRYAANCNVKPTALSNTMYRWQRA